MWFLFFGWWRIVWCLFLNGWLIIDIRGCLPLHVAFGTPEDEINKCPDGMNEEDEQGPE